MGRGRPTKYNAELQAKADWYAGEGWIECGDAVPSQEGLACELGLALSTVREWGTDGKHPDFSVTLAKIAAQQARTAVNKGLSGDFNAAITKLVLHNHGYSDKVQQEVSGPNGGPVQHQHGVDLSSLSDAALAELMNARTADPD